MPHLSHQYKKVVMVTSLVVFVLLHDFKYTSSTLENIQAPPINIISSYANGQGFASKKKNDAYEQSNGFFISTTNKDWEKYRHRFHSQHRHVDNDVRNRRDHITTTSSSTTTTTDGTEEEMGMGDNAADDNNNSINDTEKEEMFYRDNYDAEFTCLNEVQLGVAHVETPDVHLQTPKWICDPHRILAVSRERERNQVKMGKGMLLRKGNDDNDGTSGGKDGCLVYAFGNTSFNPQKFFHDLRSEFQIGNDDDPNTTTTRTRRMNDVEDDPHSDQGRDPDADPDADTTPTSSSSTSSALHAHSHSCEIHAFSPSWDALQEIGMNRIELEEEIGVILHPWGIESKSNAHLGRRDHLTFQETLEQLGHDADRTTIDILSIDCDDGCEWHIYKDILESGIFISQILMELHGAPYQVNDLFLEMKRHGYVIFHKDSHHTVSVADGGDGGDGNGKDDGSDGNIHSQTHSYSFIRLAEGFFQQ